MTDERDDLISSFSSADSLPVKLLINDGVRTLSPVHVQWLPTNQCNLRCPFCSCAKADRSAQMGTQTAKAVIDELAGMGAKAVTITGGGEPLCHPDLDAMIDRFMYRGIAVGLVTNGLLLKKMSPVALDCLTWCRVSHGDCRVLSENYARDLSAVVTDHPDVDWAFSYVVGKEPKLEEVRRVVEFANAHDFTHVRLVADLTCPDEVDMRPIQERLGDIDQKVIYQSRNTPVRSSRCTIGYVKPLIAPDFKVYLCCGVQYALMRMSLDLPEELCMGSALDLGTIYREKKPISVSCVRCYYQNYNRLLEPLTREVHHPEFL